MSNTKVIYCPCCGSIAQRWVDTWRFFFKSYFVKCENTACGLRTQNFATDKEADLVWNSRYQGAANWFTMESAPQDGRVILVYDPKFGVQDAQWKEDINFPEGGKAWRSVDGDSWSTGLYYTPFQPIYWTHKPSLPESLKNASQ